MSKKENLHLSNVPLFRSLPAEELSNLLKKYKSWDAPAGTLVLQEGQAGDDEISRADQCPQQLATAASHGPHSSLHAGRLVTIVAFSCSPATCCYVSSRLHCSI